MEPLQNAGNDGLVWVEESKPAHNESAVGYVIDEEVG